MTWTELLSRLERDALYDIAMVLEIAGRSFMDAPKLRAAILAKMGEAP